MRCWASFSVTCWDGERLSQLHIYIRMHEPDLNHSRSRSPTRAIDREQLELVVAHVPVSRRPVGYICLQLACPVHAHMYTYFELAIASTKYFALSLRSTAAGVGIRNN
jgi:hypothetical protein